MAKVLVVEDNETLREGIAQVLTRMGHTALAAEGGRQGLERFKEARPDLVITDLKMDDVDGMQVLASIRETRPEAMVIMITAFGSIETAVEAMQAGAFDFLPKPFPPELLRAKVSRALEVGAERARAERLVEENAILREDAAGSFDEAIVGDSQAMATILERVRRVAGSESTVYIHGESGTGKELVARAIHKASSRADGPFVKVNCSALAEGLLESELFGHEKGAFTGAHKRRLGRFELAEGGTIFLDEIGDIQPATQLKLLRVLQEREFERVGGEETLKADVRVVTATHRDLREEVAKGRFREDLFYRLHIIPVELPPLRDRREDVPALARHFVEKLAQRTRSSARSIGEEAMALLTRYDWPGNVRELENVIEHAMVFARGESIGVEDLPPALGGGAQVVEGMDLSAVEASSLPEVLEALERSLIVAALEKAQGVKAETARLLGIKSSALYYKLEKYGVEAPDEETSD
ncbi:sigma-54-dependent Fis family transcriptional regulator [Lujinxingia vulgaris]|uniref:Sigma-54-dependent Fis family transcriptional regulator n=1 Tax=Lujinxingia vulgaris TaxID=2600176 RepID=A0A5C6X2L0_9DELT|nr:sigma-54 dependent transcriptional regulator [Lujinxingia vulgaris]TXD35983.1 sigma-54-dependent Fis family transcriptional regulator [Lujinxingia vulgaris]